MVIDANTDPCEPKWIYSNQGNNHNCSACLKSKCVICKLICNDKCIVSFATRTKFCLSLSSDVTCCVSNVIYAIKCKKCGMTYVGETKRELKQRIAEHRRNIQKNKTDSYLVKHFNANGHSLDDLEILILENLDQTCGKQERLKKENFWIRSLVSAFPFGLNDKIDKYGIVSNGISPLNHKNHPYFSIKIPRKPRNRCRRPFKHSRSSSHSNIYSIIDFLKNDNPDGRLLFVKLFNLSKKLLRSLLCMLNEGSLQISQETKLGIEAILARRFQEKLTHGLEKKKIFVSVDFPNKGMEKLHLHTIFKDRRIVKLTGATNQSNTWDVILAYKFMQPEGRRLMTYSKELKHLNSASLLEALKQNCDCQQSKFNYQPAGHIITGDMNFVSNSQLHKILSYGTNYRMPVKIDYDEVETTANECINNVAIKLKRKNGLDMNMAEFIEKCQDIMNKRLSYLRKYTDEASSMLDQVAIQEHKNISKKFVIAPVDKAANNYVFVCKKHYFQLMCTELGISYNSISQSWEAVGNETYELCHVDVNGLFKEHQCAASHFGVQITKDDLVLPRLFAAVKMHKSPYKMRYIAGARNSSTKPVAVLLTRILAHIKEHFQKYCNRITENIGSSVYWSINSSLEGIAKINCPEKIHYVTTADFSTLYTCLPHDYIKEQMWFLISKMFHNNDDKRYIKVTYENVFYTNTKGENDLVFLKEDVMEMINFVLDNTYVQFAEFIFRQKCGVPMGGNTSPLLADLTLSVCEYRFLTNKDNAGERINLRHTMRYIDDLLCINAPMFLDTCHSIYPAELPLEHTNPGSYTECNFLDLGIQITSTEQLKLNLYNKTDVFNFDVIRYVHSTSNIHSQVAFNTFFGQLVRFARICSHQKDFVCAAHNLINSFISKGYSPNDLDRITAKMFKTYSMLVAKFGFHQNSKRKLIHPALQ